MNPLYTVTAALEKMKKYCAFQDRCIQEVRLKLASEGFKGEQAEFVIAELISEGFINEERFARSFARGKFRINQWGRVKIEAGLKAKGISAACIRLGMSEIRDEEYASMLKRIAAKLKPAGKVGPKERRLWVQRLMSRGFEPDKVYALTGSQDEPEDAFE